VTLGWPKISEPAHKKHKKEKSYNLDFIKIKPFAFQKTLLSGVVMHTCSHSYWGEAQELRAKPQSHRETLSL
jgi:hypothetical protein